MSLPAPAAIVTGTVPGYPLGYCLARLIPQGCLGPNYLQGLQVVGNLDEFGFFSIVAWNNSYAALYPSITQFTITARGGSSYTVLVSITSQSQDISEQLAGH